MERVLVQAVGRNSIALFTGQQNAARWETRSYISTPVASADGAMDGRDVNLIISGCKTPDVVAYITG